MPPRLVIPRIPCKNCAMTDHITLTLPDLQATFAAHGARLETLSYRGGPSLVLHADPVAHPQWRDVYPGAIVGPIANRVGRGAFTLNGERYQMPCNEDGMTALHSGPDGLDQHEWEVTEQSETAVTFRATLADGDGGLPANRAIEVSYRLDGATLSLDIRATSDAPTPINIAHHPYWRLGDASQHKLWVAADHYLPVDAHNIPKGEIAPLDNTAFDHRTARPLDPAIDHNLCLSDAPRPAPVHIATLSGADGLSLRIDSTEAGLQVYAGAHLPVIAGTDIAPFAGIALEPQGYPDAVNHGGFPAIICSPERPYAQKTRYHIDRAT